MVQLLYYVANSVQIIQGGNGSLRLAPATHLSNKVRNTRITDIVHRICPIL